MDVQPELWQRYLHPEHGDVTLHALRYTVTRRIGLYLDQEVEDTNLSGVIGDFGGLADLIGFDSLEIQGFERLPYKGKAVIDQWKNRDDLKPTVRQLVEYLIIMGREDILTDMKLLIQADVEHFLTRAERFAQRQAPLQDETVSSGPGMEEVPRLITVGEVRSGRQLSYDAFVCYNPMGNSSRDLQFVREMISRLESDPFNLKLFVPYRDDLVGLNAHKITTTIISERCRHMIVVLSQNFLESESAEFQSAFAFSLSPCARKRRIIPARLDDCPTPNIMKIMSMCDFSKPDLFDWNWQRLAQSITKPLLESDFVLVPYGDSQGLAENQPSDLDSAIGSMGSSQYSASHTAPVSLPPSQAFGSRGQSQQMPLGHCHTSPIPRPARDTRSSQQPLMSNNSPLVSRSSPAPAQGRRRLRNETPPRTQSPSNIFQGIADVFKSKKSKHATTTF